MKEIDILNYNILLINLDGSFYAVEGRCPHKNYPLQLGSLKGRVLRCGFHSAEFDVTSGRVLSQPVDAQSPIRDLRTYRIKVKKSEVFVELADQL